MRRLGLALTGMVIALAAWGPARAQQRGEPLAEAAAPYALYQQDLSWLASAAITAPEALDEALDRAARHDPNAVARGRLAFEALVAAQAPLFAAGVRSRVRIASRAAVLRRLNADLAYARRRPPGAAEAIQLVLQSSEADGARFGVAADRYLVLGDALRTVAWAGAPELDRTQRQARLRALAAPIASADFVAGLRTAPLSAPLSQALRPARMDFIDRVLTLAAFYVLEATPTSPARMNALWPDDGVGQCLTMARLQLRQCVSVTQFPYENAFCLARHGLREPGACFGGIAAR